MGKDLFQLGAEEGIPAGRKCPPTVVSPGLPRDRLVRLDQGRALRGKFLGESSLSVQIEWMIVSEGDILKGICGVEDGPKELRELIAETL